MRVNAHWLPPNCAVVPTIREEEIEVHGRSITLCVPDPTPGEIGQLAAYLKQQQERVLQTRSVADIVDTLDQVAARWLDPEYPLRKRACEAISALSGFSPEMVAHAIDLEQLSSRKGDMLAALDRELGDHRALDGFVPTPKGASMAIGPQLIGGIFSANIPALPHLTVMRSLLVKAACLGRVSKNEPVYLPLYIESLAQVDQELASCLAVLHWDHNNNPVQSAFLAEIDHLIAYGGDSGLSQIRVQCPENLGASWHGHRMGFAFLSKASLATDVELLAKQIAYDFSVFDQHACLAPQACFIEEGGPLSPAQFTELLVQAMAHWLETLPPRRLSNNEAAVLRQQHDNIWVGQTLGSRKVQLFTPPTQLQGTVVLESLNGFEPCPLDRFARVVPVSSSKHLLELLEPLSRYLQCAAIAGPTDAHLHASLARLGVTRICSPGQMGTPSMVWAHDGRACLAELVRWCDQEIRPPGN